MQIERQSSIARSEVTESVEYGDEAGDGERTRGLGNDGRIKGIDKEGVGVVEGEEEAWKSRLCEEVRRERRPRIGGLETPLRGGSNSRPDEESALTWAPTSGVAGVEVGGL